ncbi:MAG TPA: sugar phosphate nucleotidyltransferase [Terriglobales bacterium]|jgi:NDP-sugar pyrophosphorylase family protein
MDSMPDVAILCGGLGTRLQGVLGGVPKALAPVGGRPFLAGLIDELNGAGFARCVLCVGVGASQIRQALGARPGIVFSEESSPMGTGGALALARESAASDPVLVMNGDSTVPGLDWSGLVRSYESGRVAGVIVLVPRDARTDSGVVRLDAAGRVSALAEKAELAGADYQSAGIYLLSRRLLDRIPAGRPCSLERDLMPGWIEAGLRGYVHPGRVTDIGTPARLAQAQAESSAETSK